MGGSDTLQICKRLKDYDVSLAYSGAFTDRLTENFISFSDDLIINQKNNPKVAKTTNFLLCESFQNIVRHTEGENKSYQELDLLNGYFSFHNKGNDYRINTINPILEEDKQKAISSIDYVNNKNALELRELYKEKLRDGEYSEKGGAGLGFIQMARKTGKEILYRITSRNDHTDWLHQQVMISDKKESVHTSAIDMSQSQFTDMVEQKDILQYKGAFTEPGLISISGIVKANLNSTENSPEKNLEITTFFDSLFKNAFQHGAQLNGKVEGSLVVCKKGKAFHIEMGNLILKENSEEIRSTFENLIKNYKDSPNPTNIETMCLVAEKFSFEIESYDDIYSFLIIHLRIGL